MKRSLIVQGKNLEQALKRAEILLHCEQESIAYEVLQAPQPGRYGRPGVACKLRVLPVATAPQDWDNPLSRMEDAICDMPLPWTPAQIDRLPCAAFLKAVEEAASGAIVPPVRPSAATASTLREFSGDIGVHTGNVIHDGNVRISGNVLKGMHIQASGSIYISGHTETAYLDAGGDIFIGGGMLGSARSARGHIVCQFAQGANLQAPYGNVTVHDLAMHSQIHAGHTVFVGEIVVGGSCYGEEFVEVKTAGSESDVGVLLITGHNKRVMEDLEAIRRDAQQIVEQIGKYDRAIQELQISEERGKALPTVERIRLLQAVGKKSRLNHILFDLSRQKSTLLGMINAEPAARVSITDRAYPKVKIEIDNLAMEIKNITQFATFSKDTETGKLRMTPYR